MYTKFKFFFLSLSLALLIGLGVNDYLHAQTGCGTEPISEAELYQRFQTVGFIPGSAQTASNIQTSYSIPIKVFVITSGQVNNFPDPEFWVQEAIRWMNERTKSENFSFYLCGIENKENPSYFTLNISNSTPLVQLTDLYGDPQALNVFIVNELVGLNAVGVYGSRNGMVNNAIALSVGAYQDISVFAHEVGHFLGLAHTHENSIGQRSCSGQSQIVPRYRPDNSCLSTFCGGTTGSTSGDFIPDTNVDPYMPELGLYFCNQADCDDPCEITVPMAGCLPLETLIYFPPRDNIMSYYFRSCKTIFTPKQLELMKRMLDFGAGYAFLRDQILPTNQNVSGNFPSQGTIWYPYDPDGTTGTIVESLIPFPNLKMTIERNGVPCVSTTNSQGNYTICQSSSSGQNYLYGPNLNGETAPWSQAITGVTTSDLIQIQKYLLGQRGLNNYHLVAADADANEIISIDDIDRIRKVILGVTVDFSPLPNWRFIPYAGLFGWVPSSWLIHELVTEGTHDGTIKPFNSNWASFNNQLRNYNCTNCNTYFSKLEFTAPLRAAMNEKAWSFVGVKMGDINFSTNVASNSLRSTELSVSFAQDRGLRGNTKLNIRKGDYFNVLITGKPKDRGVKVAGYQFALQVNSSYANVIGVSPGEVRKFEPEGFAIELQEKGSIKTVWIGDDPIQLNGEKILFQIVLQAVEDVVRLEDVLQLDPESLVPEFVSDREELLNLELGFKVKSENSAFNLVKAFPNPTQDELNFELDCAEAGQIEVILSDVFGHQSRKVYPVEKGKNILPFGNTSSLLPGVLHYLITNNKMQLTGQVLKHK
ncbi:MAG: M12 family metallo-peptidase [Haliscomenobacter sp.]|uniref:reprolysin-like metallopeptidase n=1 Tax=Haliscomenobacter sp. TaxID=2717303 RepID=UPI0029BE35B3|nr:M12 family metallo-peptidase [Haliscomenobacter sp.]MDX2067106.1 M12 family metallo-peptidase [Haliscomenobacter sp.]